MNVHVLYISYNPVHTLTCEITGKHIMAKTEGMTQQRGGKGLEGQREGAREGGVHFYITSMQKLTFYYINASSVLTVSQSTSLSPIPGHDYVHVSWPSLSVILLL